MTLPVYASNSRDDIFLRWSGYADQDGLIENIKTGKTTTVSRRILSTGSSPRYIGIGNEQAYEGQYIIITNRNNSEYNFSTVDPISGEWARGGLLKNLNPYYRGFEKAVMADLNNDGKIEGFSNFFISNISVIEGNIANLEITRSRSTRPRGNQERRIAISLW
jgi:hypothetical protein